MDPETLLAWPAPERNKQPILEVLERWFEAPGDVLELASGTGQHAVYFAQHLPHLKWHPSELDSELVSVIEARVALAKLANLKSPRLVDVLRPIGIEQRFKGMFCANLVHISPWQVSEALFALAGRVLEPQGRLVTYGPYRVGGEHTSESNREFEGWLKARDERFGVRAIEDLESAALPHGIRLLERVPMPANNFSLLWQREDPPE